MTGEAHQATAPQRDRYWKMSNANPARRQRRIEQAIPADRTGCWEWPGTRLLNGYGIMRAGQGAGPNARWYVHRVSYELFVGPIPDGLQIDHLCRNRACFNPDHLEPVTPLVNFERGMHPSAVSQRTNRCVRDMHDMIGDNIMGEGAGQRRCRECNKEWQRARYWRNKALRESA